MQAIYLRFLDNAAHPWIIAAIILFVISGIGCAFFSLYNSARIKGIIILAASGLLLNLAVAGFTYKKFSRKSPETLTEKTVLNKSIYSPLTDKKCKLIDTYDEGGYSLQACPGVLGYTLQVEDFDARMTIIVVDPENNEHPQDYCQFVTGHFSELGEKAEWRIGKVDGKERPIALIVRVYSQDLDNVYKKVSYLAVSKITPEEICVTNRILPGPKQNELAKQAADRAISSKCLDAVND